MSTKATLGEETRLLTTILAAVDVLFSPMRGTYKDTVDQNHGDAEIFHRRREYRDEHGMPWNVGGAQADRQGGSRLLARLAEAGLLTTHGDDRKRRIKLTPTGDDIARQVSGGYTLFACWPAFNSIARAVREKRGSGILTSNPQGRAEAASRSVLDDLVRGDEQLRPLLRMHGIQQFLLALVLARLRRDFQ